MVRSLWTISLLAATFAGCATVENSSEQDTARAAHPNWVGEALDSPPPPSRREDMPKLTERDVWIPGYYEPYAGAWVWHQGRVIAKKTGYEVVPASYPQEDGKFHLNPPHWQRADLAKR